MIRVQTTEHRRLADSEARRADWKNWGPYVSDRAWGTVREDYSPDGEAWDYFPHDHARSRAYRWNEDGLAGFCNRLQNICLAVALWNERDPFLKERLYGVAGREGNHGEDVKEYYYHLDGTPTHSYMKMLYRYPQAEFPYAMLSEQNRRRGRDLPEYELADAIGESLREGRYFDVFIEYAKAAPEDILCRITAINRGPDAAPIHILPHIWFRNTWSWGHNSVRPNLSAEDASAIRAEHRHLGHRWWYVRSSNRTGPELLFTDNDTNTQHLFGWPNASPYVKDAINDAVVNGQQNWVNAARTGTKAAAHFHAVLAPGGEFIVDVRFAPAQGDRPFGDFAQALKRRADEANRFYRSIQLPGLTAEERRVQRAAFAGLLWNKQFYHYGVELWLNGDPAGPPPPEVRRRGRNADWTHFYTLDVLSMPDKWEYPWFAAWDTAFHCIPLAMIDPEWAKRQIVLMLREWYMHPSGQMPAYEWALGDVNPPVHAWAAWRVYKITRNITGRADTAFLERVFHKLLLNFTWWVNRKDSDGNNIFQGGFLGLDNIGVFDRRMQLPGGGRVEQADGTAWMAMYCLNMLAIALELARVNPAYEDVATKFFEHFIYIADAINHFGGHGTGLWDEADGFYYDVLHSPDGARTPLKVRSQVGLIPLFAVETLEPDLLEMLPRFRQRMEWFIKYRERLVGGIGSLVEPGEGGRRLLTLVQRPKLERILRRVFDTGEFLSDYGVRSLSRDHAVHPYTLRADGNTYTVRYEPGESSSGFFGGNSNWRGPVWFPLNFLLIESLQKYHHYYGDALRIGVPSGSERRVTLSDAATDLSRRLIALFLSDPHHDGRRPCLNGSAWMQDDPNWREMPLFHEYFHGDSGAGLGASHQAGWTALVAKLIQQRATLGK